MFIDISQTAGFFSPLQRRPVFYESVLISQISKTFFKAEIIEKTSLSSTGQLISPSKHFCHFCFHSHGDFLQHHVFANVSHKHYYILEFTLDPDPDPVLLGICLFPRELISYTFFFFLSMGHSVQLQHLNWLR